MIVVPIFDEFAAMRWLQDKTILLIHDTQVVIVIKKLINAHDIISLNLEIHQQFKDVETVWDLASLQDLKRIRSELLVYHRQEFSSFRLIDRYANKMNTLFHSIETRLSA